VSVAERRRLLPVAREREPSSAVLVVAASALVAARVEAMLRSRSGLLVAVSAPAELTRRLDERAAAIAAARAGLIVLHPDALKAPAEARAAEPRGGAALTPREREILEMMAEGMSNRTIAARLGISSQTVKFHVASILAKLGARSRTEAVTFGVRHGLIAL
jgi:DNA-binding NarL/FixJ family response regulator